MLLAVSGGPDSLALLIAASAWKRSAGQAAPEIRVATVDHRLRPESAAEAAFVAELASRCGLPHETLVWPGWDGAGNLSASAREARYELLVSHARRHDLGLVLTGHHHDDDVETHLIRRENGADLFGRAGMRPLRWLGPDVLLGRPFLDLPREMLATVVAAEGIAPVDDPSNRDPAYDRARIRLALGEDAKLRAKAARDLARCKEARRRGEGALAGLLADLETTGRLRCDGGGAVVLDHTALSDISDRCAGHLLSRAIVAVSGRAEPPSRAQIRDLLGWLRAAAIGADRSGNEGARGTRSLGGALVAIEGREIVLMREFGRTGIPALPLALAEPLRRGFAPEMAAPVLSDGRAVVDAGSWTGFAGARIVALGSLGLGGRRIRCLPVVVDGAGRPRAAAHAARARLAPGIAPLPLRFLTRRRLWRDLFDEEA
nr:tRNA lysidine(34) synthetase TilS [Jiella endophytica]